ncbi:MAG TPA: class I SAM-dependent methyltransferase [Chitinophagaceae bacterium]
MYSPIQLASRYLQYWLTASNGKGHGVHSPFVFEFITRVLNGEGDSAVYSQMEQLRRQLRHDHREVVVEDFGAGSRVIGSKQRSVSAIARSSLKPAKYSQLLHRIVKYYRPGSLLEIGTSLGITTAYMAKAAPGSTVITMEGANAIADLADENFKKLGVTNVEIIRGNFDDTLEPLLQKTAPPDLAFIDGNHRFEPTTRYFRQVLERAHPYTIIILDDIYWSREMEQAWKWVKEHPAVRLTIDLFAIGIVVFRPEILHPQHFRIRY